MGLPIKQRMQILGEITMDMVRKNLGMSMLVAGTFTLGYAVKNMEDAHDRERSYNTIQQIKEDAAAQCNVRLLASDRLAAMRDSLVADQSSQLAQQAQQLKDQGLLIGVIRDQQIHNTEFNRSALKKLQRDAQDTHLNSVIAAKGATAEDRAKINNAVKATK